MVPAIELPVNPVAAKAQLIRALATTRGGSSNFRQYLVERSDRPSVPTGYRAHPSRRTRPLESFGLYAHGRTDTGGWLLLRKRLQALCREVDCRCNARYRRE